MASKRVAADELAAAKSAMIGRLLRSTETAIASARFYGTRWRAGLPLETPDDRAEAIMKVTAAEVQTIAEQIAVRHRRGAHGAGRARPTRVTSCSRRSSRRRPADAAPLSGRDQRPVETVGNALEVVGAQARGAPGARGSATRKSRATGVSSRCTFGWLR